MGTYDTVTFARQLGGSEEIVATTGASVAINPSGDQRALIRVEVPANTLPTTDFVLTIGELAIASQVQADVALNYWGPLTLGLPHPPILWRQLFDDIIGHGPAPYPFTFPLANMVAPWRGGPSANRGLIFRLRSNTGFGGTFTIAEGASLEVGEASDKTGLSGLKYLRGREGSGVVEDPRTGQDVPADQLVEDGYSRGLYVAQENYDPPPRNRGRIKTRTM